MAKHCGGPLGMSDHRRMAVWAADCVEHAIASLPKTRIDRRVLAALKLARAWARGEIPVGEARKAALAAHAAARKAKDPVAVAIARAAGHCVATAHAADHGLGGYAYSLKAVERAGLDVERERKWQERKLPASIRKLVLSAVARRPALRRMFDSKA